MIEVRKLGKQFGNKLLFGDLSFRLEKGNIYGLLGQNGAGKTTLFKCLAGLEPCSGSVLGLEKEKKNLGYLPAEPFFFDFMTGKEYLNLLCQARGLSIDRVEKANFFDLPLQQYASNYSTGMKKKLAITGLLLQENEVFFLDEPFNGLDMQSHLLLEELLLRLKAKNKLILFASHIFSSMKNTCDQLLYLKNGQLQLLSSQKEYQLLEQELKQAAIGDKLDNLL